MTAGFPVSGAEIKIVNDDGSETRSGQAGRIVVRSVGAATQYLQEENETALTFREGWIVTEDAGFLDSAGRLVVLGRRDRIIVSGGENIPLEEVEAAIRLACDARDVMCVGLDDPEWGQAVAAVIESDEIIALDDLRERLKAHLASYKLPRELRIVPRLPLLGNDKPDYRAARELFR